MIGQRSRALPVSVKPSLSAPTSPAKLHFTHLSVADGLSHSDVRSIAQDKQGFMWFGTWLGGLNRYDGYTFKVYKHDDSNERSINGDNVGHLYIDHTGTLWAMTYGPGIDRYDRDSDSFIHYRHKPGDPHTLPDDTVQAIFEDETGTLWMGTHAGLCRFDRTNGTFSTYGATPNDARNFGGSSISAIGLDSTTGLLWVGIEKSGVRVLDRSTGHFTSYANDPNDPSSLSNNQVVRIFHDRAGTLWLATQHGLNRFDRRTNTFIRYLHDPQNPGSLSEDSVAEIYEDRSGRFWVSTFHGLNLMDRARGTFYTFRNDPKDPFSVGSDVFNYLALCEDSSGALWFGTRSRGVDRLPNEPERFTTYQHNPQDAGSVSANAIMGLFASSTGELWVGTETSLDRFDGHSFTHYIHNPQDRGSLTPGPQRVVAQDANGSVWTGTYGGGLEQLNGKRFTHFQHDPNNPDSLAGNDIISLAPDAKGGLWIGVHDAGLDYFDGEHFIHYYGDPSNPGALPDKWVFTLLPDKHGALWIATSSHGLVRLDTNTHKFTTYLMDPSQPGQGANWVHDLYSDGASLWVASPKGLFRFDPARGAFTRHYTEKDGLASNSVVGVEGDAEGNLWASTVNGLSKLDPKIEKFRNYDVFDGLQANEFSIASRARAPDGKLYFGGVNGLNAFYPDRLVDNPVPPPVVLTDFDLFNKPVKVGGKGSPLQQAIHVASSITLRHDQSVFRFQFAALNCTAPQKNQYAYKLEGFDRDWQYTDAMHRFATYTNLPPSDYVFRVKASNNDGVWNEKGVAVQIRILPPWWGTWWFRILCTVAIVAILWAWYRLRLRQLHHQFHISLEARVGERARIARELHDTLLQSFQGLLLQLEVVSQMQLDRPMEAKQRLDKTIERGARAITEGRDAVQGLRESAIEKNDLAKAVSSLAEELATDPAIDRAPSLSVTLEGESRELHPILRDEIFRIAGEALRNAFHHANARHIEVEFRYGEDSFRLRVRDDGEGVDKARLSDQNPRGHFGLPGMRERAKLIGGNLEIWSEIGVGTEVELRIPGDKAYPTNRKRSLLSELLARK